MNRDEVIKIMSVLRGSYPQFYRDISRQEALDTINLWADMFADDPADVVGMAVKALIATDDKGFPPHIGAVKAKIRQLTAKPEMSEQEAWTLVSRAIQNGIYGSEKEFDRLPEMLQRIVGSPNQLREWAVMDSDAVQSVVASNFQRSYRERAKHERDIAALPADVREVARALGGALSQRAIEEAVT